MPNSTQAGGRLKISVVVPVLNAEDSLGKTLGALQEQLIPANAAFEIVVSDDGSVDRTVTIAEEDRRTKVITSPPASLHGPSAARNRGVAASTGEVVVFVDSDDAPSAGWLEQIVEAFRLPNTGFATWPAITHEASSGESATRTPPSDGVLGLQGCFALRRSLFDDVGGYDSALRFGENTDLCDRAQVRCIELGMTIVRCERVTIDIVFNQPSSHYDRRRLDSAEHILRRDAAALSHDRRRRGGLLSVATVNAARRGEWSRARRFAIRAVCADPFEARNYVRLAAVLIPPVSRRRWSSNVERARF
jgi:glycosyltransferase involved in cell wall biosynthesis